MVDVLTEDFVTVKRATGMPWNRVVRKHAVPNALLPLVTLLALQFGAVVGGLITIETIFSWPGLGELTYNAINDKDFPVLQGTFLVFSVAVIVANLLADALYFVLDPRVQTHDGRRRRGRPRAAVRHQARAVFDVLLALFAFLAVFGARSRRMTRSRRAPPCSSRPRPRTCWARRSRAPTCCRR